jgi:hypothetical protein
MRIFSPQIPANLLFIEYPIVRVDFTPAVFIVNVDKVISNTLNDTRMEPL